MSANVTLEDLRAEEELTTAARSSLYALLASAFSFPTDEVAEMLAAGGFRDEMQALAPSLPYSLSLDGSPAGERSLAREEVGEHYLGLFDVGRTRPPCPLYEGAHRRGRKEVMEELVRFYEHFGLRHEAGDLPDHLCTELEFMHYLAFKQTAALRSGTDAEPYRLAQRDFLERHLVRWLPSVRGRLEQLEATPAYLSLARLAEDACRADLRWLAAGEGA